MKPAPPNPAHRQESEIYKYKGLMLLSIDPKIKRFENTFLVRIAGSEAEFSLVTGEKIHGSVGVVEDRLILKWFKLGDNADTMQYAYRMLMNELMGEAEIVPFGINDDDDDE